MSTAPEPICRKFVPVEQSEVTSTSKSVGFKFRLVSYNILAQVYVKSSYFPLTGTFSQSSLMSFIPENWIRQIPWWKAQPHAILTVLKDLEADILCLQEVDEYDTFYKKNMESLGYASICVKRTGRKRDGCGIFYKQDNAELVMEEKIDYNDLVDSVGDGKPHPWIALAATI